MGGASWVFPDVVAELPDLAVFRPPYLEIIRVLVSLFFAGLDIFCYLSEEIWWDVP